MAKKPDPKEDPKFKGVVQHFLNTKPKPRGPSKRPLVKAKQNGEKVENKKPDSA